MSQKNNIFGLGFRPEPIKIHLNKMNITDDIRKCLTCEECSELVSCGPVYFIHGTSAAICGRCSSLAGTKDNKKKGKTLSLTRSRNLQYEALAKHFTFPCTYASDGCPEKMKFSPEKPNAHERHCSFRTFTCPIVETGSCDWIGSHRNLKEHCDLAHPENVFENRCTLPRPDITKSHLVNYLISAYDFLFLVQLKVCLKTGQLCHAVRMFGDALLLDKFTYEMKIEGKTKVLTEMGSVLEPELMVLQESTAICTSIGHLLGIFNGQYEDKKFTLTIYHLQNYKEPNSQVSRATHGENIFGNFTPLPPVTFNFCPDTPRVNTFGASFGQTLELKKKVYL